MIDVKISAESTWGTAVHLSITAAPHRGHSVSLPPISRDGRHRVNVRCSCGDTLTVDTTTVRSIRSRLHSPRPGELEMLTPEPAEVVPPEPEPEPEPEFEVHGIEDALASLGDAVARGSELAAAQREINADATKAAKTIERILKTCAALVGLRGQVDDDNVAFTSSGYGYANKATINPRTGELGEIRSYSLVHKLWSALPTILARHTAACAEETKAIRGARSDIVFVHNAARLVEALMKTPDGSPAAAALLLERLKTDDDLRDALAALDDTEDVSVVLEFYRERIAAPNTTAVWKNIHKEGPYR